MKILYVATSFPAPEKGDTIYTDLAEELVYSGHKVTVVVSAERKYTDKTQWCKERGCDVLRVKTGNLYDVNLIEKAISILSLEYFIKKAIKRYLSNEEYDLILYESPPVTNCGIIKCAKKMFKSKTYLMLKDIFPQNAVDINIIRKNSISYRIFKAKEKKLYKVSDKIGCMSEGNRTYLIEHNKYLKDNCVEIFENTKKILPQNNIMQRDNTIRERYSIPKDAVLVLYGGNMGKPQGLHVLCEAINRLKENSKVYFVLVGRGTEKAKIKDYLKLNNCKNVLLLDNLPRKEYEYIVSAADIGIVMLDYRFTIPNYPSRILSYMEYSIPVVAATDTNTDFKNLIENSQCGLWCCSSDIDMLCESILKLSNNERYRKKLGENGRDYMEKNFDVKISVKKLEKFIRENTLM